jgi:formylglycine-generating enzyme required for sulfatase activity
MRGLVLAAAVVTAAASEPVRLGTSAALYPFVRQWAEAQARDDPGWRFLLPDPAGSASAGAVAKVATGELDAAVLGRPLRPAEAKEFARLFGGPPILVPLGTPPPFGKENRSALGVLVHPDNPLRRISLPQLDAVLSVLRYRGHADAVVTWGQLGATGEWSGQPIRAYAPEAASGTGQFIVESVLLGAGYAATVKELPRLTDAVVRTVANDRFGLGITTLNFGTDGVRPLAIAATDEGDAHFPDDASCAAGLYPLARQVYLCLPPARGTPVRPSLRQFAEFLVSEAGQRAIAASGLLPLTAPARRAAAAFLAPTPPAEGNAHVLPDHGIELLWVEAGRFHLGSPADENSRGVDEGPLTSVEITRGFWLGRTEVTQTQWRAVMGTDPSRFRGSTCPVEQVSWNEAMEFCARVTAHEAATGRLPAGFRYTLPTEAQWEFVAQDGAEGVWNDSPDPYAWHDQNSGGTTRPVATKRANRAGFHDLLGNVWEWCADWYAPYPGGAVQDYSGPKDGFAKASRGGSWWAGPRGQRPANRYRDMPQNGNDDLGFRIALTAEPGTAR